jgi:hypothetical protein
MVTLYKSIRESDQYTIKFNVGRIQDHIVAPCLYSHLLATNQPCNTSLIQRSEHLQGNTTTVPSQPVATAAVSAPASVEPIPLTEEEQEKQNKIALA